MCLNVSPYVRCTRTTASIFYSVLKSHLKLSNEMFVNLAYMLDVVMNYLQYVTLYIFSVPSFKNLPEETISKIADVLEEVRKK